jgi:Domain of unknown function (DUF4249)
MRRSVFVILSFCMVLLCSCEKTITFHLDDSAPKLVVEATIENDQAPLVFLSTSLDYFSKISPAILAGSFVHNAEVYVSNGTVTKQLKEYSFPIGNQYAIYYYSTDTSNPGPAFFGQLKTKYSLRIIHNGQEYLASTTIPDIRKRIDSIGWRLAPPNNDTDKVALMVKATDPPGFGDYIRYFTKRNSEPFYPGLNSVFDDQVIDGTTYEVQVERGVDRNASIPEDFVFFNKGDTVTLKLCNIDKTTFDFWRTMEFSYSNLGNPFSSPTKVLGNISNGALGYFGGYAAQFRTIIIPR